MNIGVGGAARTVSVSADTGVVGEPGGDAKKPGRYYVRLTTDGNGAAEYPVELDLSVTGAGPATTAAAAPPPPSDAAPPADTTTAAADGPSTSTLTVIVGALSALVVVLIGAVVVLLLRLRSVAGGTATRSADMQSSGFRGR